MTNKWQCTVCGNVGTVGRCCGRDTRVPIGGEDDAAMTTETKAISATDAATAATGEWSVRLDDYGTPAAITRNGFDILHLQPSLRTAECLQLVVDALNEREI